MEARFKRARCSYDMEGNLLVTFQIEREYTAPVRKFVAEMQDKPYMLTAKQYRKKRSLDANAYFWVLAGKLAAVQGISPEEVYRQYIREIGDNFEIFPVRNDALATFRRNWEDGRIGWICDELGASKLDGYTNVVCYYGSSTYDTRQMSSLIDFIVQDCREQGIETMPPRELAALKEAWGQ